MKSKCPAAVVTVVRPSRCRHSEATTRPGRTWSKYVWEQQINWSPWEFFFPQQFMTSATIHKTLSRPSFHFYNWCSAQTTFKCTALLYLFFYYPPTCALIPPPVFQSFNRWHRPPLPFMPAHLFLNPFFPLTGWPQIGASDLPGDAWSHTHKHLCCIVFSTKVTQGNNKAFSMLRCIPTLRVKQTCSSLSHHNPNPPTPAAALLNPLSSDISNYDCPVLLIKQIYFNCI